MNSNRDMLPGETMFDYLKRKKKNMLQKTINRSKYNENEVFDTSFRHNDSMDGLQATKRNQSKQTCHRSNLRNPNKAESQSTTPRRVGLIEQERRPATRSFLQMISPIRSKSPIQKETDQSIKTSPRFSKKDSSKDNYTKKVLQDQVNNLRQMIESLVKSGRNLKEKFHFLAVQLQPYFRHIEFCQDAKIQKKTEVIKAQLKAVQRNFADFNIEMTRDVIESLHLKFSQHINQLEGQALAQIQNNKENLISEITQTKNMEIANLQDGKRKLERQLLNQRKQFEKLQQRFEQLEIQVQNNNCNSEKQYKQTLRRYQQDLQSYKQSNLEMKYQIEQLSEKLAEKQSDLKRLKYEKQKCQEECFVTINKVKGEQEEFLLNQIMVLKTQFNNDINQMAALHKTKQDQLLFRIKQTIKQKEPIQRRLNQLIKINIQLEQLSKNDRAQAIRYKKQNEMLAIDMHRINQELYQHWLALKDIKILSMRLDIFPKFKKIYEEMLFNEQLFL